MTLDLSTWLTEEDAAARLGVSERTLRRRCEDGTGPERQYRPVDGRKPEPVYRPDDVERLAPPRPAVFSERNPLLPQPHANGLPAPPLELPAGAGMTLAGAIESAVLRAAEMIADRFPAPKPDALWLTIDQAAQYTGLSQTLIALLVRGGKLNAFRDHSIKVLRSDLDKLDSASVLSKWRQELGGACNEMRQVLAARKAARR